LYRGPTMDCRWRANQKIASSFASTVTSSHRPNLPDRLWLPFLVCERVDGTWPSDVSVAEVGRQVRQQTRRLPKRDGRDFSPPRANRRHHLPLLRSCVDFTISIQDAQLFLGWSFKNLWLTSCSAHVVECTASESNIPFPSRRTLPITH
jgi:ribosomal protein S30